MTTENDILTERPRLAWPRRDHQNHVSPDRVECDISDQEANSFFKRATQTWPVRLLKGKRKP